MPMDTSLNIPMEQKAFAKIKIPTIYENKVFVYFLSQQFHLTYELRRCLTLITDFRTEDMVQRVRSNYMYMIRLD